MSLIIAQNNNLNTKNTSLNTINNLNSNLNNNLVKNVNKKYLIVLRKKHFVEQHYKSFMLWKLNLEKSSNVPSYKTWHWRSFYSRKKKFEFQQKCFLVNLYLSLHFWKPTNDMFLRGFIHESVKGWGGSYNSIQKYYELEKMIQHNFIEKQQVSLTNIDSNWLTLKPRGWVRLNNNVVLSDKFIIDMNLENYMLIDNNQHGFQFKLFCNLPKIIHNRCKIKVSSWYLKVLLLRGVKYPVLFDYSSLPLLTNLSYFSERQYLPWNSTLQPDGVWQIDPIALKMIDISKGLTDAFKKGKITEYSIKQRWYDLLNNKDRIGELTQESMTQELYIILKLLQKAKKLI